MGKTNIPPKCHPAGMLNEHSNDPAGRLLVSRQLVITGLHTCSEATFSLLTGEQASSSVAQVDNDDTKVCDEANLYLCVPLRSAKSSIDPHNLPSQENDRTTKSTYISEARRSITTK
jgi:hypothetical protein